MSYSINTKVSWAQTRNECMKKKIKKELTAEDKLNHLIYLINAYIYRIESERIPREELDTAYILREMLKEITL